MLDSDLQKFKAMLKEIHAMYNRELTAMTAKMWLGVMRPYSIEAIDGAFQAYLRSGTRCPVPADILSFLPDPLGHVGPEEAWNMAPKSDRDCGYVTDQIMTAVSAADDSIERGDLIGARMAFVEAYKRELGKAQASGLVARYWYSEATGMEPIQRLELKERHIIEAAEKRWLEPQKAMNRLESICAELGKSSQPHLTRLQKLTSAPLQIENGLPNVKPNLKRISEGLRLISVGTKPNEAVSSDRKAKENSK